MRKTLKVFAAILGALFFMIAIAIVLLPLIIDPNQFKTQLAEAIREKTGREVEFSGDLRVSVFPSLGVSVERIRIKNVQGFPEPDFLGIEQGDIQVRLLPLLRKRVEIKRVDLKGLRLNLIRTEAGLNNWNVVASESGASAAGSSKKASPSQEEAELSFLLVDGASLKDSEIIWDDRQAGRHVKIDEINLDVGAFTWDQFTDMALKLSILEPKSGNRDRIDLKTRVRLKLNRAAADFADVALMWTRETKAQAGEALVTKLTAPAISFEKEAQALLAPELHIESGGVSVVSRLNGTHLMGKADVQAGIEIIQFNPREVLPRFGIAAPNFQDARAFTRLQAAFNLHMVNNKLTIDALRCRLDDTLLQGDGFVEGWDTPSIHFNLAGDAIDVGRYLPSEGRKNKLVSPSAVIASALAKLPAEQLRKLDAQGELHLQHLKMKDLAAEDIHLQLNAREGVIQTRQGIGLFYRGGYSGRVDFSAKGGEPVVVLTEKVEGVDIEAILKVFGSKINMSGALTGSMALQGHGSDLKQIRSGMKGKLAFGIKDGVIKETKFLKIIDEGIGLLNQASIPAGYGDGIVFSEISGSGVLAEQEIQSEDLLVEAPLFRIAGSGLTNLDTGLVDYRFVVNLVKAQAKATDPKQFHSTPIVVNMFGTLDDPRYRLDTAALLTEKNKAKIEKFLDKNKGKIDKLKDKLDKKLGPGVGDLLDRLF